MALAFHRYPSLDWSNKSEVRRYTARRNIEAARSKLLRAASQLEKAERDEAAHRLRMALCAIDDALDEC